MAHAPPGPPDLVEHWRRQWYRAFPPQDYLRFVRRAARTPFLSRRMEVLTHGRGGRLYAGAKLYALRHRAGADLLRVAGVAAVMTPPDERGRGHAARLVRALAGRARRRGDDAALLWSEIDPAYYARLGYRAMPFFAWRGLLRRGAAARGVCAGTASDVRSMVAHYRAAAARRAFGLLPDAPFVRFKLLAYAVYHEQGGGHRGHPYLLVHGRGRRFAFVVSRRQGRDLELCLWGQASGVARIVAALGAAAGEELRVEWSGPGAGELAPLFHSVRRRRDATMMALPLRRGVELPWTSDASAFAIERF